MSKTTTENSGNVSTKIVAATFDIEIGSKEVSAKRIWKQFGYFDSQKPDYGMEKVNFPVNAIIYLNQTCLKVIQL